MMKREKQLKIHGFDRKKTPVFAFAVILALACVFLCSCDLLSDGTQYADVSENNRSADGFIYTLYENKTVSITGYEGSSTSISLTIPSKIDNYKVLEIGDGAFAENQNLVYVKMEEGIRRIGNRAFAECAVLVRVDLASTVSEIGDMAFDSSEKLSEINNGVGLVSIGDRAFQYCSSLGRIVFHEGLESIGLEAFYSTRLNSIRLPQSLKTLGAGAFSCCESLGYADLGSITVLPEYVFEKCSQLTTVKLSKDLVSIEDRAFRKCESLTDINIGKKVEKIGNAVFGDTPWLQSQTDELVIVGDGVLIAYNGTQTDVVIPKKVKYISDAFAGSDTLRAVTIDCKVKEVSPYAFSGCVNLSKATVVGSVEKIGKGAFNGCSSLVVISLPKSLKTVDENAFSSCKSLDSVEFSGTRSSWSKITFGKGNERLTAAKINCK